MLRTRTWKSSSLRLLSDSDRDEALLICDRDAVTNVFVSARLRAAGLDPGRLGAQLWGYTDRGRLTSLCYSGANLVPVAATSSATTAFAGRARLQGRRCSSIVGPAPAVQEMWDLLSPYWAGPATSGPCSRCWLSPAHPQVAPDPLVRAVRPGELDILLPACVDMFTEEVGVSPVGVDGGAAYRARVMELIRVGRSFARIEGGRVIFKAEIGSVTPQVCQVQGVWVPPDLRGRGIAAHGMAAVVAIALESIAPVVTLYVNDYNAPARAAYRRAGFIEAGTFMSILF